MSIEKNISGNLYDELADAEEKIRYYEEKLEEAKDIKDDILADIEKLEEDK